VILIVILPNLGTVDCAGVQSDRDGDDASGAPARSLLPFVLPVEVPRTALLARLGVAITPRASTASPSGGSTAKCPTTRSNEVPGQQLDAAGSVDCVGFLHRSRWQNHDGQDAVDSRRIGDG